MSSESSPSSNRYRRNSTRESITSRDESNSPPLAGKRKTVAKATVRKGTPIKNKRISNTNNKRDKSTVKSTVGRTNPKIMVASDGSESRISKAKFSSLPVKQPILKKTSKRRSPTPGSRVIRNSSYVVNERTANNTRSLAKERHLSHLMQQRDRLELRESILKGKPQEPMDHLAVMESRDILESRVPASGCGQYVDNIGERELDAMRLF